MFIGRNLDGSLYGFWSVRQPDDEHHPRQEEVADNHPDLVAFIQSRLDAEEAERLRLLNLRGDALAVELLDRLRAATPTQISNYVDNNVLDLPSARTMFKRSLLIMALIAR